MFNWYSRSSLSCSVGLRLGLFAGHSTIFGSYFKANSTILENYVNNRCDGQRSTNIGPSSVCYTGKPMYLDPKENWARIGIYMLKLMVKILSVLIPFRKPEPAHLCILHLLFKKFHYYQSSTYWFSFLLGAEPACTLHKPNFNCGY